jgi:hypothetical protein
MKPPATAKPFTAAIVGFQRPRFSDVLKNLIAPMPFD